MWQDRIAVDPTLTDGAKSFLRLLARHSSRQGKPVFGAQQRQAELLGRSSRSVRRYREEAEAAGYIRTDRARPERNRSTGQWWRRHSNVYHLVIPKGPVRPSRPGQRRQQRCSHLADTGDRSTLVDKTAPSPWAKGGGAALLEVAPVRPPCSACLGDRLVLQNNSNTAEPCPECCQRKDDTSLPPSLPQTEPRVPNAIDALRALRASRGV